MPTSQASKGAPDTLLSPFASTAGTALDDRRASMRDEQRIGLMLTSVGGGESRPCITKDISEGGVQVEVPPEYGLSVGQRCEVIFASDGQSKAPPHLAGEMRYATVVRTEHAGDPNSPVIGTGLRFDRPLFL